MSEIKFWAWMLGIGLFFLAGQGFAQNAAALKKADQLYGEASSLFEQQKDSLAVVKYQQAKTIYVANKKMGPELVGACLGMGIIFQTAEKYHQAISAYKESIRYRHNFSPRVDTSYIFTFLLISGCYIQLNQYDSVYAYYGRAEPLLDRYPRHQQASRYYNSKGYFFYSLGNYVQSINYFEKALKSLNFDSKAVGQSNEKLVRYVLYNSNYAGALRRLGRYREAIAKTKGLMRYGYIPNILNQNIASAYLLMKLPDSARVFLNKVNISDINLNPIPGSSGVNPTKAEIEYYTSLGQVSLQEKDSRQALSYFVKARQISLKNFSPKNGQLANTYTGIGQAYELQHQYAGALKNYQLAIQALHFDFKGPDIYRNPQNLDNAVSPLLLFKVLGQKAQALGQYYGRTRNTEDLQASLHTYQLAFRLADLIRKGYDSDEAKLFFTDIVAPVYEDAIATAYQLFTQTNKTLYLDAAFALAEQSKAAVLAESLRELEIQQVPGISPALLRQERDLKLNIAAINLKLVEVNNLAREELYQDQLRENEIKLAKTLKELEKNKQYYQLKYDTSAIKVSEIQKDLDGETAFLEYFVGKKNLFVFVITREGFEARRLALTPAFIRDWKALYKALYQAQPGFRYQGDPAAHRLYRQLVAPVAASLAGKQRLIIVQDKELCYLPFEALVSSPQTARYLLQDYTISYAYSGKLLRQTTRKNGLGRGPSIMAMAPFAHTGSRKIGLRADNLTPLYASAQEVEKIGGQIYMGPEATKQRWMAQAPGYDIVHLATHAKADIREPLHSFIAFYPKADLPSGYRLYVREIYNLRLDKLKLVVLSACETGGGQLVQGEGIMSLARAFAYAGCPSTVTTLWKAEDKTTAYISTRLYKYLKAGKPKDVALRLAKLDYLNNQTNWRQRSPVYWANFIFIGDQAPVYTNYAFLWWVLGALLTGLAGWLLYQKRRSGRLHLKKGRDAALVNRLRT